MMILVNNLFRVLKNKPLVLVCSIQFFSMLTGSMSRAVLMQFALDMEASIVEVGLISLLSGIINTICQVPFGILSDRIGRKVLILFSESVNCLTILARGLSTTPLHLLIISPFGGLGGVETPGLVAAVGDLTEPSDRPDALSSFFIFSSVGLLIGPAAAGLLILFMPIRIVFFISAMIHVLDIILVFLIKGLKKPSGTGYKKDVVRVLKKKNMLVALDMRLSQGFFDSIRRTYIPIFAKQELGVSNALIAFLGSFEGISRIFIRFFMGKLIRKMTSKWLIVFIFSAEVAVGLLIPFSTGFHHLVIFACFAGLFHGIESPASALLVSDSSTPAERGFANSVLFLSMSSGSLAPIVTIPVSVEWGLTSVFPIAAVLPALAALVTIKLMEPLSIERGRVNS